MISNRQTGVILCSLAAICSANQQPSIILESHTLRIADGSFFNADTIEMIRKYQRNIINIVKGDLKDGQRLGRYVLNGTNYGIQELAHLEDSLDAQSPAERSCMTTELQQCLELALKDFTGMSNEFRAIAQGAKKSMLKIIEEWCKKRNRMDSIMLKVAEAEDNQEDAIVLREVTSFRILEKMCADVMNFLNDLIASCPKAQAHYQQRLAKWQKIKLLLPKLQADEMINKNAVESRFLRHVKLEYIDKVSEQDISLKSLQSVYTDFLAHNIHPNL